MKNEDSKAFLSWTYPYEVLRDRCGLIDGKVFRIDTKALRSGLSGKYFESLSWEFSQAEFNTIYLIYYCSTDFAPLLGWVYKGAFKPSGYNFDWQGRPKGWIRWEELKPMKELPFINL